MSKPKTIAVVGGGSAGFTAARTAAALGARVLFFMGDNADHASLCVEAGCMPSKAMFLPIDEMHHARRRGWWRIEPADANRLLAQIIAWKDREIEGFRRDRNDQIRQQASDAFRIIRAKACFLDSHTLQSDGQIYRADAIIIATGSTPVFPPIAGLESLRNRVWTSDDILRNPTLPASLAVIGGGPVGLEFALRYARLGCQVTMISRSPLLARYGATFGDRLRDIYELEGVRVRLGAAVVRILDHGPEGFRIELEGSEPVTAERVLLAAGRRPSVDDLQLAAAGIERLEAGDDLRVSGQDHVFAVGDVNKRRMMVHAAHIEAGIAAENATADSRRRWRRRANLEVIFSDPEFAFAGLTAPEAERAGHPVITGAEESREVGKLHLAGDDHGRAELIVDSSDHRVLGAGLLCDAAAELIHLPAYAIEHERTIHTLAEAEYYHPTRMEIIASIADALCVKLGGQPLCRAAE